jgi:hypothetical protein
MNRLYCCTVSHSYPATYPKVSTLRVCTTLLCDFSAVGKSLVLCLGASSLPYDAGTLSYLPLPVFCHQQPPASQKETEVWIGNGEFSFQPLFEHRKQRFRFAENGVNAADARAGAPHK